MKNETKDNEREHKPQTDQMSNCTNNVFFFFTTMSICIASTGHWRDYKQYSDFTLS